MNKRVLGVLGSFGLMATSAFGAFNSAQLIEATRSAVSHFEAENPDHAAHFTGYKAWKSGAEGKVKIYVDHGGHAMEFNYTCADYDGDIECIQN